MNLQPDLTELHRRCTAALAGYIEQAEQTCKVLSRISRFPVSLDEKRAILEQRQAENLAHASYDVARMALFNAANWD